MNEMTIRLDDSTSRKTRHLTYVPSEGEIETLKADFNLLGLKKAQMSATLTPKGRGDWLLSGQFGASVTQPCGVTLAPVNARIDARFERLYVTEMPDVPDGEEVEMPDDDRLEPRPSVLDLRLVFSEVLALELPEWPRAAGAELPESVQDKEEKPNPFAVLESLKSKLEGK
ncbi:MAG: DUF177 domain-containing protein [Deltaproteobacteria bacterium]